MRLFRSVLVGLALSVPVTAVDVVPTTASVGSYCTFSWYYNSNGAYKLFTVCPPGTAHQAQRAHINCNNGGRYGIWQPLPGPWAGSTATCPSGGHAVGTSYVEFY